jgi:hypothetical protein
MEVGYEETMELVKGKCSRMMCAASLDLISYLLATPRCRGWSCSLVLVRVWGILSPDPTVQWASGEWWFLFGPCLPNRQLTVSGKTGRRITDSRNWSSPKAPPSSRVPDRTTAHCPLPLRTTLIDDRCGVLCENGGWASSIVNVIKYRNRDGEACVVRRSGKYVVRAAPTYVPQAARQ